MQNITDVSASAFIWAEWTENQNIKPANGKTQREAERKAQEVKEALHRGLNLASQNDTFEH